VQILYTVVQGTYLQGCFKVIGQHVVS